MISGKAVSIGTTDLPGASARQAVAGLSLSILLASLGTSIANVGLPTLAIAFDASFQQVQWVVLAYLLATTSLVVGVGRLGDIFGRRKLLLAGIALYTAASILCGVAPDFTMLIAARALQGLGAALMLALAMALVADTVPKEQTGRVMGLLGTMSAVGTALGPSLGGGLIAAFGWPALFFVGTPLGIFAFFFVRRAIPADRRTESKQRPVFNTTGTVLLAVALAAYALAMTVGRGDFGVLNASLLAAAAIGFGAFLAVEARSKSPLIAPALLRDRVLAPSLAANALVSTVMMATLVVGPFYLSRALGLDETLTGLVMSVGPAISILCGIPAGRIVDRFGTSSVIVVGLALMATGAFALSLIPADLGVAGYVVAIAVLTPGYQLFQAANNTATLKGIASERRGVVSGMLALSRNLGLVTGASVLGAIFAFASSLVGTASAMQVTFAVAGALVLVAIAVVLATRPKGRVG